MRVLVLGAGAVGGFLGGMLQHGAAGAIEVCYLVRPSRAAALRRDGLRVGSPLGNVLARVSVLTAEDLTGQASFDVVVISCKAYDLPGALEAVAPAVGPESVVIPLLNGVLQVEKVRDFFPQANVLGGYAHFSATLLPDGSIQHTTPYAVVRLGSLAGTSDAAAQAVVQPLVAAWRQAGVTADWSTEIWRDIWLKFVFLATLAGSTCLMRGSVGEILAAAGGEVFITGMFSECVKVGTAHGLNPGDTGLTEYRQALGNLQSQVKASMLRDLERGAETEWRGIVADMLSRAARAGVETPLLNAACVHLQVYENQRLAREPDQST